MADLNIAHRHRGRSESRSIAPTTAPGARFRDYDGQNRDIGTPHHWTGREGRALNVKARGRTTPNGRTRSPARPASTHWRECGSTRSPPRKLPAARTSTVKPPAGPNPPAMGNLRIREDQRRPDSTRSWQHRTDQPSGPGRQSRPLRPDVRPSRTPRRVGPTPFRRTPGRCGNLRRQARRAHRRHLQASDTAIRPPGNGQQPIPESTCPHHNGGPGPTRRLMRAPGTASARSTLRWKRPDLPPPPQP